MSDTTTRRAAETSSRQGGDHPSGDNRFELVDKHLKRGHYAQDQLIETLHVAQDVFGYLSEDILVYVARALRLPPSLVYGVATFYELFTFDPPGDHTCTVCTGTACFVKGADAIVQGVSDRYGVPAGADRRRRQPHTEDCPLPRFMRACAGSRLRRRRDEPSDGRYDAGTRCRCDRRWQLMAAPIDLHEVAEREHEARFRTRWRVKACSSTACLSAGAGADDRRHAAGMRERRPCARGPGHPDRMYGICAVPDRSSGCCAAAATPTCTRR